jgi:hypothetical protein
MNGSDQLPFTSPPLTSSAPALNRRYTRKVSSDNPLRISS